MFLAVSCFRRRRFEECAAICSKLLEKNPYDQVKLFFQRWFRGGRFGRKDFFYRCQAAWVLKTKALTQQVYVDDCDVEEEGVAEVLLDDTAIAQMARPGTSLKTARTATPMGHLQSFRPFSNSGRPVSGVLHPGNQSSRPTTMEQAMKTPRTASHTARPVTSSSGRFIRLGTVVNTRKITSLINHSHEKKRA